MNIQKLIKKQLQIAQLQGNGQTVEEIAAERRRTLNTLKDHAAKAWNNLNQKHRCSAKA